MSTPYSGNPAGGPNLGPSPAPGNGVVPIISVPADGVDAVSAAALFVQQFETLADFVAFLMLQAYVSAADGSDGNLTLDGTSTVAGMAPSSGVYTLTRDLFANNITFTGNAKLFCSGYRVFARGIVDTTGSSIVGGGIIHADGLTGGAGGVTSAGAGAAAGPTGIVLAGAAGGNGSTGGAPSAGSNISTSFGGNGGVGGGSGSVAGVATAPAALLGTPRLLSIPHLGMIVGNNSGTATHTLYQGGGGGGGGQGSVDGGGGGGGGGGVFCIVARVFKLKTAGDIRAAGGTGGAGGGGGGHATNGGAGGGGGAAVIVCGSYSTLDSSTISSTTCTPGGAGGAGFTGGSVGGAGVHGNCYLIIASAA